MSSDLLGGPLYIVTLFCLLVSAPVGIGIAWLVLRRYQAVLLRFMSQASVQAVAAPAPVQHSPPLATRSALQIEFIDPTSTPPSSGQTSTMTKRGNRFRYRLALANAAGGAAQSIIITLLWFLFAQSTLSPRVFLALWLIFAWPITVAVMETLTTSPWRKWLTAFGVLDLYLLLAPGDVRPAILIFWPGYVGLPALLAMAIFHPRLKAVAPMAMGIVIYLLFAGNIWLSIAYLFGRTFGLGFLADVFLLALLAAALYVGGRLIANRMAHRYQAKRSNDQMLLLDTWWLLLTFWESALLSNMAEGTGWPPILGFLGLLAFAAYRVVVDYGRRSVFSQQQDQPDVSMLLLRVFGERQRATRLLDKVSLRWRFLGNIELIAAPDLATSLLEPHELLAFVGGRTKTNFVKGQEDLARRLAELDRAPDPDGRYRVHEFFGFENTWLLAVQRLIDQSHVVLMDLRSFTKERKGCTEEVRQLCDRIDLHHVVFIVNEETDKSFLRNRMQEAWQVVAASSPNLRSASPTARLIRLEDHRASDTRFLLQTLYAAARMHLGVPA